MHFHQVISFVIMSVFKAVDKTLFDNHPKIQSWLEACKAEILDYQESNHKGAEAFGQWANGALAKLQS